MSKQRDGPAPRATAPSQRVDDERAPPLPDPKSLRKLRAQPTTPKIRARRRPDDPSWRGFAVRFYLKPGSDAHALYALLRAAAERYGLEVGDVHEIHEPK
jgi:hypothetical protein